MTMNKFPFGRTEAEHNAFCDSQKCHNGNYCGFVLGKCPVCIDEYESKYGKGSWEEAQKEIAEKRAKLRAERGTEKQLKPVKPVQPKPVPKKKHRAHISKPLEIRDLFDWNGICFTTKGVKK